MRVVVIGAGVIGSAVAHRAAAAGAAVTLVDQGRPGGGTSMATLGWVNAVDKQPRDYYELNRAGMREHAALQLELDGDWLHGAGTIEWAGDAAERRALEARRDRLRDWGYPLEVLSPQDASALEPDMRLPPEAGPEVLRYPGDAWAQPAALIAALLTAAVRAGAEVRSGCRVTEVLRTGDAVRGVRMASGEVVEADAVVSCAGPASDEVCRLLGFDLPLRRKPGLLVVTEPAPVRVRGVVKAPGLSLRSDGGGRVLATEHQDSEWGLSDRFGAEVPAPSSVIATDDEACQEALRRAQALLPGLAGVRVETARVGVRPMPADGRSMVGPIPGGDGAYVVATHSGITLAPLLGRLVADEVVRGRSAPELAPFRPGRAAG